MGALKGMMEKIKWFHCEIRSKGNTERKVKRTNKYHQR